MSNMPARTPLIDDLSHYCKECRYSLFGRTKNIREEQEQGKQWVWSKQKEGVEEEKTGFLDEGLG